MNELRQLAWMEQAYNIVLMGPSGTGKTYIASGLIYDAIKRGKKGYLFTMQELITCLRAKDISAAAMQTYSRIMHADVVAIDDIMLFPIKKEDSAAFFNLINSLHEKVSLIITQIKLLQNGRKRWTMKSLQVHCLTGFSTSVKLSNSQGQATEWKTDKQY